MGLADKNDYPPFFEHQLYEIEVDEDEAINQTLLSLNVTDLDEVSLLSYEIVEGNEEGTFAVGNLTGNIYLTQPLDYETKKKHDLFLAVSDGRHESGTAVRVTVNDVNDNPPVFDRRLYQTLITEEDDRDLPRKIITVQVTDGDYDRPCDIVFSLSGQGVNVGYPEQSHFGIDPHLGHVYVKKPLNRDYPDGRPHWGLTVFAQDEGGTGLVGYSEVVVNLKDINDVAPSFPQGLYRGTVTENGTSGLRVIQMRADDHDDPHEGSNAQLVYSMGENALDETTGKGLFLIEPDTGVVKTAVCCLDREEKDEYEIQVLATDGGGLRGTATVTIEVLDINDKPPFFTKDEWVVETDETDVFNVPVYSILNVSVSDEDETNDFFYKITSLSGFGADRFRMEANPDGTGALKVKKPLDFEDPEQSSGFRFQIEVSDVGGFAITEPNHVARSWVKVILRDINDNEPQFLKNSSKVQIFENTPPGTSLAYMPAKDRDNSGKSKISYTLDRASDRQRRFYIDSSGTIKLQRTLDREEKEIYHIRILAKDDGTPAKTASATLTVFVRDVNDNAPELLENYKPVLQENQPPSRIIDIFAVDNDDQAMNNGPPFYFRLDPQAPQDIKSSFRVDNVRRLSAEGMATVSSLREFDREKQKSYLVPIVMRDSGVPPMEGTSTLTVIIGDENDNTMRPGSKHILFYSYMGRTHGAQVGRVFVEDPDDWDSNDKTFTWTGSPHSNFKLNENNGMITMKYVLSETSYSLEFFVYDRKHAQSKVKSSVSLTVRYVSEKAIKNAGSIRIVNSTDKEFIRQWNNESNKSVPSKADNFRKKIAKLFHVEKDNVDVFSIQLKQETPPQTDVFFSVYDSYYYQSERINGVITRHKTEIEKDVGIEILMVGVNECLHGNGRCEGSCTNTLEISKSQYLVDANRTSFVGVHIVVIPKCVCSARNFSSNESCRPNPCLNGGRCIEEIYSVRCQCPSGFDGPRCQILTRTFLGNGYAWFPSLATCESSHIGVEFLSSSPDGLIFYNGPITSPNVKHPVVTDFIALEMVSNQLRLLIDLGSGTVELQVNTTYSLSDSRWHRADIFWNNEKLRLDVDHCQEVQVYGKKNVQGKYTDLSTCQAHGEFPLFSEYLDVNSPLQVGGLAYPLTSTENFKWQHKPYGHPFKGCIRRLMMNSHFYDFANPALHSGTKAGCSHFEENCASIYLNSTFRGCGPHGKCSSSVTKHVCLCEAGWTGLTCDEPTVPSYFDSQSIVQYSLAFRSSFFYIDIQLRFRTWEASGELISMANNDYTNYRILEIKDKHVYFRYRLDTRYPEEICVLSSAIVSDGLWHLVKVKQYADAVILTLDGGEGRNYNQTSSLSDVFSNSEAKEMSFSGYPQYYMKTDDVVTVQNVNQFGCLDDIRINGYPLPLPPTSVQTEWAEVTDFDNITSQCVSPVQCLNVTCVPPFVCQELWMRHECRCPEGSILSKDIHSCLDEDECLSGPCENGGICSNQQPFYVCHCPLGFDGDNCEVTQEIHNLKPTHLAFTAILVCLLILVIAVAIVSGLRQKRRASSSSDGNTEAQVTDVGVRYEVNESAEGEGGITVLDLTAMSIPSTSEISNGGNITSRVGGMETTRQTFIDLRATQSSFLRRPDVYVVGETEGV